ncbi:bacteria-like protein [Chrysochromulina tobinii]|uniref:Bacteria-like protein n=1 Tax=Chrysochromulina tobinii TaxID=1460289 RepID=A0A0M0JG07_9EUKA|nr:bacteria-like protein [Chrysochromulina tobinii]|eukprot:KOO25302.1 bacteria-like protein [Chrysochromulina sp. CCMP291]
MSLGVPAVSVGDKFPTTPVVHVGFPKAKTIAELLEGKSKVPGLKKAEIDGRLEAAGIDKVYIFCVNDGAVMEAWKKDQGLAGSDLIEFVADVQAALTEALGIMLTGEGKPYGPGEGPNFALGFHTKRCKRSAIYVVDGVIKVMSISEGGPNGEFDPAGDSFPQSSCIENVLELIGKL